MPIDQIDKSARAVLTAVCLYTTGIPKYPVIFYPLVSSYEYSKRDAIVTLFMAGSYRGCPADIIALNGF